MPSAETKENPTPLHSILGIFASTGALVFALGLVERITNGELQSLCGMPVALIHLAVATVHEDVLSGAIVYIVGRQA